VAEQSLPVPPLAWAGEPALQRPRHIPPALGRALGYAELGDWLVRVDLLEELAFRCRRAARAGGFRAPEMLCEPLGCSPEQLDGLVASLGYPRLPGAAGEGPRFGRRVSAAGEPRGPGRRRRPRGRR
jgi:hypothetical protein